MATTDKATQIFDGLLLNQYINSTNLIQYMGCFITEIDYLFEQIEEVYYGRFLESAVGAQLDVIGIILQQTRSVVLDEFYFAFDTWPLAGGFSTESDRSNGGTFQSSSQSGFEVVPLADEQYRNLLLAKAKVLNGESADINTAYDVISTIIGRVPRVLKLEETGFRQMQLSVATEDATLADLSLIDYAKRFFVPAGVSLSIQQV